MCVLVRSCVCIYALHACNHSEYRILTFKKSLIGQSNGS